MSAREEILERVRAALADVPADEPACFSVPAAGGGGGGDVELFCQRVADYRATVTRVPADAVADAVRDAFARHDAARIVVPDGFPPAWLPVGIVAVSDAALDPHALDALDGVLTTCALGIAETGTLVLDGGLGQGRRALTLVPDLHVCVVRADQIVPGVADAIAMLAATARPITLVSGPSATSDIELERVEGVHGPRRLELVVTA